MHRHLSKMCMHGPGKSARRHPPSVENLAASRVSLMLSHRERLADLGAQDRRRPTLRRVVSLQVSLFALNAPTSVKGP